MRAAFDRMFGLLMEDATVGLPAPVPPEGGGGGGLGGTLELPLGVTPEVQGCDDFATVGFALEGSFVLVLASVKMMQHILNGQWTRARGRTRTITRSLPGNSCTLTTCMLASALLASWMVKISVGKWSSESKTLI